jgi:acyl-CoA synthetase (AMP-forming)/AMP-acid ligase II
MAVLIQDCCVQIFVDANDPSNQLSATQARRMVLQLIAGFKRLGLKEGDCVCLHAFNCVRARLLLKPGYIRLLTSMSMLCDLTDQLNQIWYPVIWLAVIGSGARFVGSNPRYTALELVHLLNLTRPTFIVAQPDCMQSMIEAAAAAQHDIATEHIFSLELGQVDPPNPGYPSWRTLLKAQETDWSAYAGKTEFDPENIAVYGMTSGTTGLPKAALISHRSIVAQSTLLEHQYRGRTYQVRSPDPVDTALRPD